VEGTNAVSSDQNSPTLFCFALMLPNSYEVRLLAMQHGLKASLFSCDSYKVYSNVSTHVVPSLLTGVVDSNLTCQKGGEFGTVLNTDIFMAVWKAVIKDGLFLHTSWTVKVDPDAVFFPARLRRVLSIHAEAPQGVYLNNCWRGMHGPLEVFSRNAVKAWDAGAKQCIRHFTKKCSGTCQWGEDMFIDQCLWKVLKVRRDNVYDVLIEDHCDAPKGWRDCKQKGISAFHPFKSKHAYVRCLANADPEAADAIKAAGAAETAKEAAAPATSNRPAAPATPTTAANLPRTVASAPASDEATATHVNMPETSANPRTSNNAAAAPETMPQTAASAQPYDGATVAAVNLPQGAASAPASDESTDATVHQRTAGSAPASAEAGAVAVNLPQTAANGPASVNMPRTAASASASINMPQTASAPAPVFKPQTAARAATVAHETPRAATAGATSIASKSDEQPVSAAKATEANVPWTDPTTVQQATPAPLPVVEQGMVTGSRVSSSAPAAAKQTVPMSAMPNT